MIDAFHARRIVSELKHWAEINNARILFAVESGSRAWGFPSENSDYDVRFVYVKNLNHYLSVGDVDYISRPFFTNGRMYDFHGWDIRKFLELALASNAQCYEWYTSPEAYVMPNSGVEKNKVLDFLTDAFDAQKVFMAYRGLAEKFRRDGHDLTIYNNAKKYLYAIRSLLAALFVYHFDGYPPMEFRKLVNDMSSQVAMPRDDLLQFIAHKANGREQDLIELTPKMVEFFQQLQTLVDRIKGEMSSRGIGLVEYEALKARADLLLYELIVKPQSTIDPVFHHQV